MALEEGVVPELGQRVQFTRPLLRHRDGYRQGKGMSHYWEPGNDRSTREGIVIGKRTLWNGDVDWDEGYVHDAHEHFTAYLVVETLHSKPRRVLPEHLTILPAPDPAPAIPEGAIL